MAQHRTEVNRSFNFGKLKMPTITGFNKVALALVAVLTVLLVMYLKPPVMIQKLNSYRVASNNNPHHQEFPAIYTDNILRSSSGNQLHDNFEFIKNKTNKNSHQPEFHPLQNSSGNQRHDNFKQKANKMLELSETLPPQVIKGIEKFVMFLGNGRSGSSILGTLMDAHPHVIIAHQMLNNGLNFENPLSKTSLFNKLYSHSIYDAHQVRRFMKKGYTLGISGLWQGKYDNYIEVIGDKCGGPLIASYLEDKEKFIRNYKLLEQTILIPIRFIKPIRNPFDMIATVALVRQFGKYGKMKAKNVTKRLENETILRYIDYTLEFFDGGEELIQLFGRDNVLDVHNCDLIDDPWGSIARIFQFLEVQASEHYLNVSSASIFKSVSKSRNLMVWTPEQIEMVERRIKKYDALSRYSFTSE